jgi:A/G-specific adenine glycosylase
LRTGARRSHTGSIPFGVSGVPRPHVERFQTALREWFVQHRRDFPWRCDDTTVYEQIVSEVLLQQTPAQRVAAFLPAFFGRFSMWDQLAISREDELGVHLRPLGLWRRRARVLVALGRELAQRAGRLPSSREELETLPAVGQYVASAILLFEQGLPEPLLDVNMARVLERYFGPRRLVDIRYDPYLQALAREVVASDAVTMNWAVLDLAALVCKPRTPLCEQCPLQEGCLYDRAPRARRR